MTKHHNSIINQTMAHVPDELRAFSVQETSALLGMSKPSVYLLINSGKLRVLRLGRRTLVPAEAIRDLLRAA